MKPRRLATPAALRPELARYFESPARGDGFHNPWSSAKIPGLADVLRWKLGENTSRPKGYRPHRVPMSSAPLRDYAELAGAPTRLLWIGHASFLLELDAVRFLIDPIFGAAGGFVPRVTPPAVKVEALPSVAAVLVTHGHHDHLDGAALRALAERDAATVFVVPRGLASALPRACREVVELDWWEYVELSEVRVHLTPAQHWHRRGALDMNRALWGSYVLAGTHRVYHSGDTGYFGGFEAIREAFGGVDAACLPLGAYEPRWFMGTQHMSPEDALRAFVELDAGHFVGMHWGAYDLSDEPLDAGPPLMLQTAHARGLPLDRLHVLQPGGSLSLTGERGACTAAVRAPWHP